MSEILEELETQFNFQEYILHEKVEGYIFNFQHVIKEDSSSYGKIYFVTKNLKNYYIKVPFLYSLLIECKNIGDVEEYIKNQYSEGYHSSLIVERYDCDEYNHLNKSKKKYLQLNFKYKSIFDRLIKDLKRTLLRNNNERNIESVYKDMMEFGKDCDLTNIKSYIVNIHEYDIPYEIVIAKTYNIRAGCWFEFSYNGDVYAINSSETIGMPEFRIFAFDIETMKKPLKFPDAEFDQVMMISIKTESSNFLIINRDVVSEDIGAFEYVPKEDMGSLFKTFNMRCEEELLLKFIELIQKHKPHMVTTFNGYFFDFPYLEQRMLKYELVMGDLIGFSCESDYYSCPFILHLDCFKWVVRDSYLPMGSQGLKAVTKAKLEYFPDEIDPEEMVETALKYPIKMATYSVSDVVATYFIFIKYVQPHIFSLSSILPFSPVKILCKGSGSLCEALLMIEANNYSLLIPSEKRKGFLEVYDGKVIDSMTYVGGYVEALKSGIFRSDFEHIFKIQQDEIENMIKCTDDIFTDFEKEPDIDLVKSELKAQLLDLKENTKSTGRIYHLDVSAMYPNIILTNRLQPTSIVNNNICVRCDYSTKSSNCKRELNWEAKIDYFVPDINEIKQIEQNTIIDYNNKFAKYQNRANVFVGNSNQKKIKFDAEKYEHKFEGLSQNKQDALIKKNILEYSRNIYKKSKNSVVEKRDATVCQREIPFYVDSVMKFRDQRYVYKKKLKHSTKLYEDCSDLAKKKDYQKEMIVYSSLQIAHKCILNSFYGYVMSKGARWHSTEMAAIVCNIGAKIIKNCKSVLDKFAIPLELDTDGIWALFPSTFPFEVSFRSGRKVNFLNLYINYKVCRSFTNTQYQEKVDGEYIIKPNNSIEFEIDGPYKGMIIPAALEEGKQLKKRYIVLNWDNSIAEFKGFELKRRGELEIVKRLQEELFECFGTGETLKECYENLAKICHYWLDLINNKGRSLDDDDIFELFSECKSMSKDISEYDSKSSSILSTAQKMAELLGNDILSEKLKVEYIISEYPKNEVVSNRTIPTIVFKSQDSERFLKKWCKISRPLDIRELLDWNYYKKRVEDIVVKIISLPALHQEIVNPIHDVKIPDWTSKLTTKYDLLDYFSVKKKSYDNVPKIISRTSSIHRNKYWEYYNKIKQQNGIVKIEEFKNTYILKMYNKEHITIPIVRTLYFKAEKLFFIEHSGKFVEKYLPVGNTVEKLAYIVTNKFKKIPEILNNALITDVYNKNVHAIYQIRFCDYDICKFPEFTILTSFNFSKAIIYVFSKNGEFTFISTFKNINITCTDLKDFLLKNVNSLVILNDLDRNLDSLKVFCESYNIICEKVQIKKSLCSFSELLEIQKNVHRKISKSLKEKFDVCSYANVPIGNFEINLLDYLYYRLTEDSQGLISEGGPESNRLFKNEKINPGYYELFTIQFECVGSLILSILEYKALLDHTTFQDLNRTDFKVLYNLVKKIFIDHSKNIPGATNLLNKIESWIKWDSTFLSSSLRDLVNLLHQRYIFNVIAFLNELKMKIVYVSSNVLCIVTEKDSKDGADEIFKYCKEILSKKEGFGHLICRKLRVFEKLLIIDPNNYFYKKNFDFFCVSDIKMPIDFIKKYFLGIEMSNEYIYDMITKVEKETADLIIEILSFKPDMIELISNCKKLLKIDEYSKKKKDLEMLIVCSKCNLENVMRSRCIKCMFRYPREEIQIVVKKYFEYFLELELGDETFCNKCSRINERKLLEYCECGGLFKKRSYIRVFKIILNKLSNVHLYQEYKDKLDLYNVKI